jgi:biopolymer transport protein ExbD
MRFPRQARIFRGQIDAVPVVGVFFLLLIFLLLKSSLVFQPGVPIEFAKPVESSSSPSSVRSVRLNAKGQFIYGGRIFRDRELSDRLARLKERIRADFQAAPGGTLLVTTEPGVSHELVVRIRNLARELGLPIDVGGVPIELPEAAELPGLTDPGLVVAVDMTGRLYYDNQPISEEALKARLLDAVARSSEPLTLVVQADRQAQYGPVIEVISRLAASVGIHRCWLATQPGPFPARAPAAP